MGLGGGVEVSANKLCQANQSSIEHDELNLGSNETRHAPRASPISAGIVKASPIPTQLRWAPPSRAML